MQSDKKVSKSQTSSWGSGLNLEQILVVFPHFVCLFVWGVSVSQGFLGRRRISKWTFNLRWFPQVSDEGAERVEQNEPNNQKPNTTTNKQIRLFPNKQRKVSWSRWTGANWQQPLCGDDTPLWHRLTAIVGLCRPRSWRRRRWRWWWWRRVKATVSLHRCHLHHRQPPPPGLALITATSVFLFFFFFPRSSVVCRTNSSRHLPPLLRLSSLLLLTPPCVSSQLEAVSAPLYCGLYLHVFVRGMCVLQERVRGSVWY